MRAGLVVGSLVAATAVGVAPAAAQPAELREVLLREPAVEPPPVELDVSGAHLRGSWRLDAVAATQTLGGAGALTTTASVSLGAEVAVSHAACDAVVAGGQADLRSGAEPLSFQQWASLCPFAGVSGQLVLDHRLVWDVRPRLLAAPRRRPGPSRQETVGVELLGVRARSDEPAVGAVAAPPPEYVTYVRSRLDVTVGWQAGDRGPGDAQVAMDVGFIGFARDRADGGVPLELWIIAPRVDVLIHDEPATLLEPPSYLMAMTGRLDAVTVRGARVAGMQVDGRIGVGVGNAVVDQGQRHDLASTVTGLGALAIARDLGRGPQVVTATIGAARDQWPLWDGRLAIDDRATTSLAWTHGALRLRGELTAARAHLVAADGTIASGVTGGGVTVVDYDLGRHLTLRARSEWGWSAYAPGASPEAPRRAIDTMITAEFHAGTR